MSRSFTGCKRCKARRQKCDEQHPECGRCKASGVQCRYAMQLQWGGRAFSRSRFGACVGPGMQKLEYSPGEFIYTTVKSGSASPAESPNPNGVSSPSSPSTDLPMTRAIDPFSSLSTSQKALLHHFISDASSVTSCHSGMQQEICQMIVPMALQTPSLLYATMALSAIHLEALNNHSGTVKAAPDIARLMARSLEHFRLELQDSSRKGSDALLATARTLCLAEIHSGAIQPNTWRAHVEGAKALMNTTSQSSNTPATAFRKYLDRWYRSIVALTALNGNGPPIGETTSHTATTVSDDDPDYLDDYWGFTVHLADIFRAIGALAWQRHQESITTPQLKKLELVKKEEEAESDFDEQAARLEKSVLRLIARYSQIGGLVFYPGVKEKLSEESIQEFMLCNEAFQHTALIHIHRRVRKVPASSPEVQYSVKRILACTSQIVPRSGLSPWVMLTTPLFTGGCEALGEDREAFKQLLTSLHDTTRIPNVLQSLKFLEIYWADGAQNEDEDWSHFLDRMSFDFIPY
ncbi:C6 finger domain protein, putative [Talaromyces stipitatus ATCC 10500]|uniref:C6 finger domain protein, putative n=1 Tax=Talaromyces stipitatus (strain ATCC 10500 / CBS 375.48 / QM 6759 / NRRL 1006) TaxID=441959 RepID=B8LW81_TALSN|nr:C6 finger domain protein, putative [Talaromyces stipitatus ATCC 10500]XP_002341497.1 C6 finger domain protein, putative [Talaromyces stipitatus ATCC 10500]EED24109.1 C6 finger domain protein, putative [Talaromyces stipitatus ATCC 10500]EED24110.1 C6 finger domain protein, putative [Talaromyces stipitatus ATCC 10500]